MTELDLGLGPHEVGSSGGEDDAHKPRRGIDESLIREISWMKGEPDWMRDVRLRSHAIFERSPLPDWGVDTSQIVFDDLVSSAKPTEPATSTEPTDHRVHTDEQWGASAAEPEAVAGATGQHESEVVFNRNRRDLEAKGVLFCDMDTAVHQYPDLVRSYFGTIIPPDDNPFAALNSAVWSGGWFIYVPPGVEVEVPLQAYSGINAANMGQFERTLIIAGEGATVHYIEGCSAPVYTSDPLRSAVVEVVAESHSRITHTTIQNWSPNVLNIASRRAIAHGGAHVEWIEANFGSRVTTSSPAVHLMGPKAFGEVRSVAYAGIGQHQQTGAEMVHAAPETASKIVSKTISKDGGRTTCRGVVRVEAEAHGCGSQIQCNALVLDEASNSEIHPHLEVGAPDAVVRQETSISRVADEHLFYLQSRGLTESQARGMVVNGFIEPVTRSLPMEYAVEWSRLIELQMDGSIG